MTNKWKVIATLLIVSSMSLTTALAAQDPGANLRQWFDAINKKGMDKTLQDGNIAREKAIGQLNENINQVVENSKIKINDKGVASQSNINEAIDAHYNDSLKELDKSTKELGKYTRQKLEQAVNQAIEHEVEDQTNQILSEVIREMGQVDKAASSQ